MIHLSTVRDRPRTLEDSRTLRLVNGRYFDAMTASPIKTTTAQKEQATVARVNRLLRGDRRRSIPPIGWFLIVLAGVLGAAAFIHFR